MQHAFNEALRAWRNNEVPVGAVIVWQGNIIARAYNRVESLNDPTAHAEVLAITAAARAVGDWRLNGATMYVTKEPCPMCSGAAIMARLDALVHALADPKMGCLGGSTSLHSLPDLNHRLSVRSGVLEAECREMLQAWFQLKRANS